VRVSNTQGLGNVMQFAGLRGYFQEQGIELHREEFGSTGDVVPAIAAGQLDAGSVTPSAGFFNALARGIQLRLALDSSHIGAAGRGATYLPFMVRRGPDGPVLTDLAVLRGRRVGQPLQGNVGEWALDRMLAEVGLRLEDTESVIMSFPDMLAAFGSGGIDGAVMPEPFGTLAEERDLAVRLRDAGDYIPGAQTAVIVFSAPFARDRVAVARRFAVAYLRGAREYMDAMELGHDREEVVRLIAQSARLDPRLVDKAGYPSVRRDGHVNRQAMLDWLDWLVQHGYVSQRPDLATLFDTQFADYAAKVLDETH